MSDCAILWTVASQAPLSKGFSRQQYWSGLPYSPPGDLPDPGIEPMSPASSALQADSLPLSHGLHIYTYRYMYVCIYIYIKRLKWLSDGVVGETPLKRWSGKSFLR